MQPRHAFFPVLLILTLATLGVHNVHADPVQTRDLVDDEVIVLDSAGNVVTRGTFGGANEGRLITLISARFTSSTFDLINPNDLTSTIFLVERVNNQTVFSDQVTLQVAATGVLHEFEFRLLALSDFGEVNLPVPAGNSTLLEANDPKGQAVTSFLFSNIPQGVFHPDWFVFVRSDADPNPAEVPEPATITLFSLGLIGILTRKRVRKGPRP